MKFILSVKTISICGLFLLLALSPLIITVRAYDPLNPLPEISSISINPSTNEIILGESFTITVNGKNNGGKSGDWSTMTISFPQFTSTTDHTRISITNHNFPDTYWAAANDQIWNKNGYHFPAQYLLVEGYDNCWERGEAHHMTVRVTPKSIGTFVIYIRITLTDDDPGNPLIFNAPTSSSYTDQQSFYVIRRLVTVNPVTYPNPKIHAVNKPNEIIIGNWATIYLRGVNHGDNANQGYLQMSFPSNPPASNIELDSHNFDSGKCDIHLPGKSVFAGYGSYSTILSYPIVEGYHIPWNTNVQREMTVRVKPTSTGTFTFYVKTLALNNKDTWFYEPASGTKDQQNEFVKVYTIEVIPEPEAEPRLSYNPTNHDFKTLEPGKQESTSFNIWNSGGGTLIYEINENTPWISSVTPSDGSITGENEIIITVSINTYGLESGTYQAPISITSNGGSGTFTVYIKIILPDEPAISIHPTSHDFGKVPSGYTGSTTFSIWNSGTGTLSYSFSHSAKWITSVNPSGGSSSGELDRITTTVNIDTSGLSRGLHTTPITITSGVNSESFVVSVEVSEGTSMPTPDNSPPLIEHTALSSPQATGPFAISVRVTDREKDLNPSSPTIHYSTNFGNNWNRITAHSTSSSDEYLGNIPNQLTGTTIWYYISASDFSGLISVSPFGAPVNHYSFNVGDESDFTRPAAHLWISVKQSNVNESIMFDGSKSFGNIVAYWFDFGDGTNSNWITNHSINHQYKETGVYTVRLKVISSDGLESYFDSAQIIIDESVDMELSIPNLSFLVILMFIAIAITKRVRRRNNKCL